jgi:hypothetical protein
MESIHGQLNGCKNFHLILGKILRFMGGFITAFLLSDLDKICMNLCS